MSALILPAAVQKRMELEDRDRRRFEQLVRTISNQHEAKQAMGRAKPSKAGSEAQRHRRAVKRARKANRGR